MQLSNTPGKLVLPFAAAGGKNAIPVDSQIGITGGAASLTDGFPPLTRTPIAAGGIPPSGLDMNGILYELSNILRWANAGGGYAYDSTFATDTNVGGYPKGARVMRTDGLGYWLNTVDNNITDPSNAGAAAAGWVPDVTSGAAAVTMTNANITLTPDQYGRPFIFITGLLTGSLNLVFPNIVGSWVIVNSTTGNYAITAKTPAGSGVTCSQGASTSVFSDSVNIYSKLDALALSSGSNLIYFIQNATNALSRSLQDRGREIVYANDFSGTDTQRTQRAIDAITASGGVAILSRGAVTLGDLLIPAGVALRGQGLSSTLVTYSGSGTFALLGGTASSLYYGCEISDMHVVTASNTAQLVSAQGTCGALIKKMYLEGPINNTRTTKGVVIDGKNASSYFNRVEDVICNHMHVGYTIQSTGSVPGTTFPTTQYITNCSSVGDVGTDTASIGIEIGQYGGNGTVVTGGNMETCAYGMYLQTGCGSVNFSGVRVEGNTWDIYLEPAPAPQTFSYITNLSHAKISDNSGVGYQRHTYIGCIDSNISADKAAPYNVLPGSTEFKASGASSTPQINTAYASQAVDLILNQTSAGVRMSGVDQSFNYFANGFQFPASQVASSNVNCLDDYEEGTWTPVLGGDGGESGQTYVLQNAKYTKVGNLVTVSADIYLSAKGAITGNVVVKGLPFATNSVVGSAVNLSTFTLATATVSEKATLSESSSLIYLRIKTAAATAYSLAAGGDIANNTELYLTASYFV